MTQFVFMPLDGAWKVTYGTNHLNNNNNISILEIKSEKNGVVTTGLIPEAAAIGMIDEYVESTVTSFIGMAATKELNLYAYADRKPEININNSLCRFLEFGFPGTVGAQGGANLLTETLPFSVPNGTVVTAMIPVFTTTNGATVFIGANEIISGVTEVDMTAAKTFKVIAQDGTIREYEATVTILPA